MKKIIFGEIKKTSSIHIIGSNYQRKSFEKKLGNNEIEIKEKKIVSLYSFINNLVPNIEYISKIESITVLNQIFKKQYLGKFENIKNTDGFLEVFYSWMIFLQLENIDINNFKNTKLEDLILPLKIFEKWKKENNKFLEADGIRIASEEVKYMDLGSISISGIFDFHEIELEFLENLANKNEIKIYIPYQDNDYHNYIAKKFKKRNWQIEYEEKQELKKPELLLTAQSEKLLYKNIFKIVAEKKDLDIEIISLKTEYIKALKEEASIFKIPLKESNNINFYDGKIGRDFINMIKYLVTAEGKREKISSFPLHSDKLEDMEKLFKKEINIWEKDRYIYLKKLLDDFIYNLDENSPYFSKEIKIAQELKTVVDNWIEMKIDNLHDFYLYIKRIYVEHQIPGEKNKNGLGVYSLEEILDTKADYRIFIGGDKDFPKGKLNNFLFELLFREKKLLEYTIENDKLNARLEDAIFNSNSFGIANIKKEGKIDLTPLLIPLAESLNSIDLGEYYPGGEYAFINKDKNKYLKADSKKFNKYLKYRKNPGAPINKNSYSASSLNMYNKCPFKFWIKYSILKDEDKKNSPYLEKGNLYHNILAEYIMKEKEQINNCIKVEKLPRINKISLFKLVEKKCSESEFWNEKYYIEMIYEKLYEYLKEDMNILLSKKVKIESVEEKFSYSLIKEDRKIYFKGIKDRVDKGNGKNIIGDYKTKNLASKNSLLNLEDFQLAIYALSDSNPDVYYGSIENKNIIYIYIENGKGFLSEKEWKKLLNSAEEKIFNIDEMVNRGEFPLKPDDRVCKYCEYASICRKGEKR